MSAPASDEEFDSSSKNGHMDQDKYQQRQREEFQSGTDKAREEARRERDEDDDQGERVHSRSGAKKSSTGKEEKQSDTKDHSLFVNHLITTYPILTATYHEVTSRLPISIPNPTELPIISRFPSPARLPIISSIDARLDSILTRIDTTFPVLKSSPEHLASQVAQLTDPWVAPANYWLVEHLPQSKRSGNDDPAVRERRKAQGKSWAASVAPGEKSYADAATPDNDASSNQQDKDKEAQSEMELRKTLAILLDALDSQVERVEEAREYVAEVLLPGYVPLVGCWLGGKVKSKGGKHQEKKEKSGKKTGEEERSGKKYDGQKRGSKKKNVEQVDGGANEGVTVVGGSEL